MKLMLAAFIFIYTFAKSYGCKTDWYNQCERNGDCCSGNCDKEGNWKFGICKPRPTAPSRSNSCHPNWYNKCGNNDECCSGYCEKEGNWKYGICKTDKESAPEPGNKPGGRGSDLSECGISRKKPQPMIWQGETVETGDFPWHAGVYEFRSDKYVQVCGGSLISTRTIISAAHCFTTDNLEERKIYIKALSTLKIAVGKRFRDYSASEDSSTVQYKDIDKVYIPQKYTGQLKQYEADIAVVSLKDDVHFTKFVSPVCIDISGNSFEGNSLVIGAIGKVVGWGQTETHKSSDRLLSAQMPYVSRQECWQHITQDFLLFLKEDKICAGSKTLHSNICKGDSGGGLVFVDRKRYFLRGIVSLGAYCDGVEGYALFTKISTYKNFIRNYM